MHYWNSILLLSAGFIAAQACLHCNKTYLAPCNMKFPYGDENDMGADVTLNDTNTVVCHETVEYTPEYGKCPFPPEDPNDMKLTDPYIKCPQFPAIPGRAVPEGTALSSSHALCKSCDVQLAPDSSVVNLKCVDCYDVPSPDRTANLTQKNLIYSAYYVEIANYTSVAVQGRENLNP